MIKRERGWLMEREREKERPTQRKRKTENKIERVGDGEREIHAQKKEDREIV